MNMYRDRKSCRLSLGNSNFMWLKPKTIFFRGFLWNSMKQTQRLTGHLDQCELTSCDVREKKNNTSPLYYLNVQWQKAREVNNVLSVAHIHTHFIHKTSRKMRDKIKKCISGSRHTVIPALILRIQQLKLTSANCPSTSLWKILIIL